MKLLFNLEVVAGNRVRARPSDYLRSLPRNGQAAAVTEFLHWAGKEAADSSDPQARAEAGTGIATTREFLQTLQADTPRIYTGRLPDGPHD